MRPVQPLLIVLALMAGACADMPPGRSPLEPLGTLFVVGFLLLWLVWGLMSSGSAILLSRLMPGGSGFLRPLLIAVAVFLVGAVVGATFLCMGPKRR